MKKFSLRYSSTGILLFMAVSILIANMYTFFLRNGISNEEIKSNVRMIQENMAENTMFSITRSSRYYEPSTRMSNESYDFYEVTNFYAVRQEVDNFPMTQEFADEYPDLIAYRSESSGNIVVESKEYTPVLEESKRVRDSGEVNIEDPNITTHIVSNIRDLYYLNSTAESQMQEFISNAKNPTIEFKYMNGQKDIKVHNLTNGNLDQEELTKIFVDVMNNKLVFKTSEHKIQSLNMFLEIKPEVAGISTYATNRAKFSYNLIGIFQSAIAIAAVFFVFGLATNYEKSKSVSFYQILRKIPVETIILIGFGAVLIYSYSIERIFYYPFDISLNPFFFKLSSQMAVSSIVAAICITILLYLVNAGKSFYFEGFKSDYVRYSVVVKIIGHAADLAKTIFNGVFSTIVSENATSKIRWAIGVFVLFLIGLISGFHPVIWALIILAMGFVLNQFIEDFKTIEENTERIRDGILTNQVPTRTKYFNNISDNLENIYNDLSSAIEKEVKSERLKTELITNVSHDLKTPLTSIISYSDLVVNTNPSDEELKKYVEIIHDKSLKLKVLIDNLFDVAKVTSNNVEVNKIPIHLNQMIEQILGEWHDELDRNNLSVITNIKGTPREVNLDGDHTSRIFDNLISNIRKYAQENTRIYLDLDYQEDKTVVSIKNISKYALNISADELMERFTRGDESRNTEGSGLGLAIATSLVEIQGGKFDIEIDGDMFKTTIIFY